MLIEILWLAIIVMTLHTPIDKIIKSHNRICISMPGSTFSISPEISTMTDENGVVAKVIVLRCARKKVLESKQEKSI